MNRFLLVLLAAGLSGQLFAYGVSPERAMQGNAPGVGPAPVVNNGPMPTPNATATMVAIINYKPQDWAKAWDHIGLPEAIKLQADPSVLFADARAKVEYDQGHIPYAIPLPVGTDFEKYYAIYKSRILKARKIVTYCHGAGCLLSDKCAKELYETHHLHKVAAFFGGWPQWQQSNLPIETGPEPKARP